MSDELLKALRTVTVNLTAAVSAYEAKARKRDAFGRVRMRDFNHAISVGRAAIESFSSRPDQWKESAEWACSLLCSATPGKVLTEDQSREWCEGFGKWFAEYQALQGGAVINPEWKRLGPNSFEELKAYCRTLEPWASSEAWNKAQTNPEAAKAHQACVEMRKIIYWP